MANPGLVPGRASATGRIFHGWWMVGSGFLLMFYSTGVGFFGFSAFVDDIANAIAGGSRAAIAIAVSVQRAEAGILSPVMGFLVDRIGPRRVLVGGFIVGGLGFILVSLAQNLAQFYAAYFFLALGLGAGSFLVVSTAVSNWFIRKRGRALGVLFLGPGFAGFLVIGIIALIEILGWRSTMQIIGVGMWAFCLPLALVMRGPPENYGLRPDGDTDESLAADAAAIGGGSQRPQVIDVAPPIGGVLRSRTYWQYVLILALQQTGFSALVIYQIPALKTFGLSLPEAGLAVLIWTLGGIPGRLGSGFLADMFDKRLVLAGAFTLQLVGVILFLTASSFPGAVLYGLVHGAGWGATTPSRLALQGEYWGRAIFGRLMGVQAGASAAGGILSPIWVGWMFDRTGDYHFPLWVVMFVPLLIAIVLILTLRRPQSA